MSRERIAGDYPHLNLSSDQVMVTAGSQEALYLILRTLVEEGDEVLIPNPGFIPYPMILKLVGGRAIPYRLPAANDFGFDLDEFKSKLSARTKAVICISPSNPSPITTGGSSSSNRSACSSRFASAMAVPLTQTHATTNNASIKTTIEGFRISGEYMKQFLAGE